MLCTRVAADLELAFRGEARGAFSWLQCFITDEEDWCSTTGCPGTPFVLMAGLAPEVHFR